MLVEEVLCDLFVVWLVFGFEGVVEVLVVVGFCLWLCEDGLLL